MNCIILVLFVIQIQIESRTVNSNYKYNKGLVKSDVVKCSELPPIVLNDILGAAFNSR